MNLTTPRNAIRIKRPSLAANYRYHFVSGKRQPTTVCGIVLHCSLYEWEAAKVENIKPDELCSKCWPFGHVKEPRRKRLGHTALEAWTSGRRVSGADYGPLFEMTQEE